MFEWYFNGKTHCDYIFMALNGMKKNMPSPFSMVNRWQIVGFHGGFMVPPLLSFAMLTQPHGPPSSFLSHGNHGEIM
jgi:hypothetical protein